MLRRSSKWCCPRIAGSKPVVTPEEAVADIASGSTLIIGGFGSGGAPHALCTALAKRAPHISDFSVFTNAGSIKGYGIGLLFEKRQVRRVACSHLGSNSFAESQYMRGDLEI